MVIYLALITEFLVDDVVFIGAMKGMHGERMKEVLVEYTCLRLRWACLHCFLYSQVVWPYHLAVWTI